MLPGASYSLQGRGHLENLVGKKSEDNIKLDILKHVVAVIWIHLAESRHQLNAVVKVTETLLPGVN